MAKIKFFRLSGFVLLSIMLLASGCGWFCAQYFPTTMPYAGTQTYVHLIKDSWAEAIQDEQSKSNNDDSEKPPSPILKICAATFGTAYACLDMPLTFVADTLTLPAQLYWYVTYDNIEHGLRYLRDKEERKAEEQSRSDEKINVKQPSTELK